LLSLLPEIPPSFQPSSGSRKLSPQEVQALIARNHSLNGGIIFGLNGYVVEVQGQAMRGLQSPLPRRSAVQISGMAKGAISEAMDRISGAFTKLNVPVSPVEILVNLAPADLEKEGTWLDLPLAMVILQAAGFLPELPDHRQGNFILSGELDIRGDVRRVPGPCPSPIVPSRART